ncbi:NAD(P)/FAD-dependent oxidoreductase [Candidatus Methanoperedens nitratireducens]|uniref:NAD(P)H-nitrite reductase n=1 Tax=Candidatus Methanoperedens nitratireducens TaxID=1392998 RepID=A0A284VN76_9EURY
MVSKSESSAGRLVIIGGVAAGMSAASKARRLKPDIEILVFEKGGYVSYGSCGLPYYISGMIKSPEDLVVYDAKFFREKRNIGVFLYHEAVAIQPEKHLVLVRDGKKGEVKEYQYSKLLIATGARAFVPPIKGTDLEGIFTIRLLPDGIKIKDFLREKSPKKALIIGAGYIGMEMAETLMRLGIKVTMVARGHNILGTMESEISKIVEDELGRNGVTLLKSTQVEEFKGENGYLRSAVLNNGETIDIDMALVATGVRPNSGIAKEAGIELGSKGAVRVNERMETNVPNIYSAGDCAEAYHQVLKRQFYLPLGTIANKQGKVAGENMVGGDASFKGVVATSTFKVFDLQVARTGLLRKRLKKKVLVTSPVPLKRVREHIIIPAEAGYWSS